MTQRRCELIPFLLDQVDCALEQIELARNADDRVAALDTAMNALMAAKARVGENETIQTSLMLVLDEWMFSPHARKSWNTLAEAPADQFNKAADELVKALQAAKGGIEAQASHRV